jgi:hypothetical protein
MTFKENRILNPTIIFILPDSPLVLKIGFEVILLVIILSFLNYTVFFVLFSLKT